MTGMNMQNIGDYSFSFSEAGTQKFIRPLSGIAHVSINTKNITTSVEPSKIKQIIQAALDQPITKHLSQRNIRIENIDETLNSYQVRINNGKIQTLHIDPSTAPKTRVIKLGTQTLLNRPSWGNRFMSHMADFFLFPSTLPGQVAFGTVSAVFFILSIPAALFWSSRQMSSDSKKRASTLKPSYSTFNHALLLSTTLLKKMPPSERKYAETMQKATDLGKEIEKALTATSGRRERIRELAKKLEVQVTSSLKNTEEMIIPMGYHTGGHFQAMLLHFHRKEDGQLTLQVMNDDPHAGTSEMQRIHTFHLKEGASGKNLQEMFLRLLHELQESSSPSAREQTRREGLADHIASKEEIIRELRAQEDLAEGVPEASAATAILGSSVYSFIEHTIRGAFESDPEGDVTPTHSSRYDSNLFMMEWINLHFPGCSDEESIERFMLVAQELSSVVIEEYSQLSPEEALQAAQHSLEMLHALRRKIALLHGNGIEGKNIVLPKSLEDNLKQLKIIINQKTLAVQNANALRVKEKLRHPHNIKSNHVSLPAKPTVLVEATRAGAADSTSATTGPCSSTTYWEHKVWNAKKDQLDAHFTLETSVQQQCYKFLTAIASYSPELSDSLKEKLSVVSADGTRRLEALKEWILEDGIDILFTKLPEYYESAQSLEHDEALEKAAESIACLKHLIASPQQYTVAKQNIHEYQYTLLEDFMASSFPHAQMPFALHEEFKILFAAKDFYLPSLNAPAEAVLEALDFTTDYAAAAEIANQDHRKNVMSDYRHVYNECAKLQTEALAIEDLNVRRVKFEEIARKTTELLKSLPSPNQQLFTGGENFWDLTPAAEDWSSLISKTERLLWESKMRLSGSEGLEAGKNMLWPDQKLMLWKCRAIRLELQRNQSKSIQEKYITRFNTLPRAEREALKAEMDTKYPPNCRYTCINVTEFDEDCQLTKFGFTPLKRKGLRKITDSDTAVFGYLGKRLGIPKSEAQTLLFDGFTEDTKLFETHLFQDPYLCISSDIELDQTMSALHSYFHSDRKWGECSSNNSLDLRPCMYDNGVISQTFYRATLSISEAYDAPTLPSDFEGQLSRESVDEYALVIDSSLANEKNLPTMLVDMNRSSLYYNTLDRPSETSKVQEKTDHSGRVNLLAEPALTLATYGSGELGSIVLKNHDMPVLLMQRQATADAAEHPTKTNAIVSHQNASTLSQLVMCSEDDAQCNYKRPKNSINKGHQPVTIYRALRNSSGADSAAMRLAMVTDVGGTSLYGTPIEGRDSLLLCLDFISDYFPKLEDPEVQEKIEISLFRGYAIQSLLRDNPHMISSFIGELSCAMDRADAEGNHTIFAFLTHIKNRLTLHVAHSLEIHEKQGIYNPYHHPVVPLNKARSSWELSPELTQDYPEDIPSSHIDMIKKQVVPLRAALADLESLSLSRAKMETRLEPPFNEEKPDIPHDLQEQYTSLLEDYMLYGENIETLTDQELGHILYGYHLLSAATIHSGIPYIQEEIRNWVKEKILVQLQGVFELDIEKRDAILQNFINLYFRGNKEDLDSCCGEHIIWEQINDHPYHFQLTNKATKQTLISLNIFTGKIGGSVSAAQTARMAQREVELPSVICENALYQKLFAKMQLKAKKSEDGDTVNYTCMINDQEFVFRYDNNLHNADALSIFMTRHGKKFKYEKAETHHESIDPLAQLIKTKGCWISLDAPHEYRLFADTCYTQVESEVFVLENNFHGQIRARESKGSLYIANDPSLAEGERIFPLVKAENVIWLCHPQTKAIVEARLIGTNITIKKSSSGRWTAYEGSNCLGNWWQISNNALTEKRFSSYHKSFVLPTFKELPEKTLPGEISCDYLMMPYSILRDEEGLLKFNQNAAIAPLHVRVDTCLQLHGSSQAFLYMAYVHLCEADSSDELIANTAYKKAIECLKKAEESKAGTSVEDLETFQRIVQMIETFHEQNKELIPHPKTLTVLLKAELCIQRIRRLQLAEHEFTKESADEDFKRVCRISDNFRSYNELMVYAPFERRLFADDPTFPQGKLSLQELNELQSITKEAMSAIIQRAATGERFDISGHRASDLHFNVPKNPSELAVSNVILELTRQAKHPDYYRGHAPSVTEGVVNHEELLRNFWVYWKEIKAKGLVPEDIPSLFSPSRYTSTGNPELDSYQIAVDKEARMMLIFLAKSNEISLQAKDSYTKSIEHLKLELQGTESFKVALKTIHNDTEEPDEGDLKSFLSTTEWELLEQLNGPCDDALDTMGEYNFEVLLSSSQDGIQDYYETMLALEQLFSQMSSFLKSCKTGKKPELCEKIQTLINKAQKAKAHLNQNLLPSIKAIKLLAKAQRKISEIPILRHKLQALPSREALITAVSAFKDIDPSALSMGDLLSLWWKLPSGQTGALKKFQGARTSIEGYGATFGVLTASVLPQIALESPDLVLSIERRSVEPDHKPVKGTSTYALLREELEKEDSLFSPQEVAFLQKKLEERGGRSTQHKPILELLNDLLEGHAMNAVARRREVELQERIEHIVTENATRSKVFYEENPTGIKLVPGIHHPTEDELREQSELFASNPSKLSSFESTLKRLIKGRKEGFDCESCTASEEYIFALASELHLHQNHFQLEALVLMLNEILNSDNSIYDKLVDIEHLFLEHTSSFPHAYAQHFSNTIDRSSTEKWSFYAEKIAQSKTRKRDLVKMITSVNNIDSLELLREASKSLYRVADPVFRDLKRLAIQSTICRLERHTARSPLLSSGPNNILMDLLIYNDSLNPEELLRGLQSYERGVAAQLSQRKVREEKINIAELEAFLESDSDSGLRRDLERALDLYEPPETQVNSTFLSTHNVMQVHKQIREDLSLAYTRKKQIITLIAAQIHIHSDEVPEDILALYRSPSTLESTGEQLLALLGQHYQHDELLGIGDLDQLYTEYLLETTKHQQLVIADRLKVTFDSIKNEMFVVRRKLARYPKEDAHPERIELLRQRYILEDQWRTLSYKLSTTLTKGLDKRRYLFRNGEGVDIPRQHYKKYLLAEARQGIIFRDAQVEKIESIFENPSLLVELRMGIGKTSMILPALYSILADQNTFCIGIVPHALLGINQDEMDFSTRNMFEQSAFVFDFDRKTVSTKTMDSLRHSKIHVLEEYENLLRAKKGKNYVLSTIEAKASLADKIVELEKQRAVNYAQWQRLNSVTGPARDEDTLTERWEFLEGLSDIINTLRLIQNLFEDKDTQLIIDEVDSILPPNNQVNYETDNREPLNAQITQGTAAIFQSIFSEHSENLSAGELNALNILQKAILSNQQSGLSKIEVDTAMKALASQWYEDQVSRMHGDCDKVLKALGTKDQFIAYLIDGKTKPDTDFYKKFGECALKGFGSLIQTEVAILRSTLKEVLPTALGDKADIHFGIDHNNGFLVVPRDNQIEIPDTKFADSIMQSVRQFLYYSIRPPEAKYLNIALDELINDAHGPYGGQEWFDQLRDFMVLYHSDSSTSEDYLYETLNSASVPWALQARLALATKSSSRISISVDQVMLPVQTAVRNCRFVGLTGTARRYLPRSLDMSCIDSEGKKVTADVYARLKYGHKEGYKTPILSYSDDEEEQLDFFADTATELSNGRFSYHFILNQGGALDLVSTREIVEYLADSSAGRPIIYVDRSSGEAKKFLYMDGIHQALDKQFIDPDTALYYYAVPDSRGTHFDIPPSTKGRIFIAPTCNSADFEQAVYRARGLGETHTMELCIPKAMEQRISSQSGQAVTLGSVLNDVIETTDREDQLLNLMSHIQHIQGTLYAQASKAMNDIVEHSSRLSSEEMKLELRDQTELFSLLESLMIHHKEIEEQFKQTFNAGGQESTQIYLQNLCKAEAQRATVLMEAIAAKQAELKARDGDFSALSTRRWNHAYNSIEKAQSDLNKLYDTELSRLEVWNSIYAPYVPKTVFSQPGSSNQHATSQSQEQAQAQAQAQSQRSSRGSGSDDEFLDQLNELEQLSALDCWGDADLGLYHQAGGGIRAARIRAHVPQGSFSKALGPLSLDNTTEKLMNEWSEEGPVPGWMVVIQKGDGSTQLTYINPMNAIKSLHDLSRPWLSIDVGGEDKTRMAVYHISHDPSKDGEMQIRILPWMHEAVDGVDLLPDLERDDTKRDLLLARLYLGYANLKEEEWTFLAEHISHYSDDWVSLRARLSKLPTWPQVIAKIPALAEDLAPVI